MFIILFVIKLYLKLKKKSFGQNTIYLQSKYFKYSTLTQQENISRTN